MAKRRFTPSQIMVVRDRVQAGESKRIIAAEYGVGTETIARICRGDTYGYVARSAEESARRVAELVGVVESGIAIRPTAMMLEAQEQANGKAKPSEGLLRELGQVGKIPPMSEALKALAKPEVKGTFGKIADVEEPERELPPGVYDIPEVGDETQKD